MAGFGMTLGGYGAGQQGLAQYLNAMAEQKIRQQQIEQTQQSQQAQGLIPGAMLALLQNGGAGGGQGPQPIPNPGVMAPASPGMPTSGGVSPQGDGMSPAGGVPGGAGPVNSAMPGGVGTSPNMADLWRYLQTTGAPPNIQAAAGKDIYSLMLPQQRLEDALLRARITGEYGLDRARLQGDYGLERVDRQQAGANSRTDKGIASRTGARDWHIQNMDNNMLIAGLKSATSARDAAVQAGFGPGTPQYDDADTAYKASLKEYNARRQKSGLPAKAEEGGAAATTASKYTVGQIIPGADGQQYRVTGLTDPNDPDVELVK